MFIEKIELFHFRNYERLILEPHPGINIFFGKNGSGKTNLLEAVHYCSLGKSHRISQDVNAVMKGQEGAVCRIQLQSRFSGKSVEVRLRPGEDSVKTVLIDRKRISRLQEMMGVLRCVIFSPEDLNLIREGPSVRRKFMDMMISQVSKPYFVALQQYRGALNHRNTLLKNARAGNGRLSPVAEDFERAMAEHGALICREREKYVRMISEYGNQIYREISGNEEEDFQVRYHPSISLEENPEDSLLKALRNRREEDLRTGSTSAGPHRDELEMRLNGQPLRMYASQGQMRTASLSLKLAQLRMISGVTEDQPVLLLDDVMSELDLDRRMNLLQIIGNIQTFITCSDEGDLAAWQNHRTYRVFSRDGKAALEEVKSGVDTGLRENPDPVFE